ALHRIASRHEHETRREMLPKTGHVSGINLAGNKSWRGKKQRQRARERRVLFAMLESPEVMDSSSARSVLLIDDDEELCDLLTKFLGHEGFAIEAVNDAAVGLELAVAGKHSVVVLDVMLPQMNGFDVLRAIRKRSPVPVI